jgi:AraC-like DNA-binding protein
MNLEANSAYRIGKVAVEERVLGHGDDAARPASVEVQMRDRGLAAPSIEGSCMRVGIRAGFDISFYDLLIRNDHQAEGYSEPSLIVAALIDGDGEGYLIAEGQESGPKGIRYAKNMLILHYAEVRAFGGYRVKSNSHFRMVEMRFSLAFLEKLGVSGLFEKLGTSHPLHLTSADRIWVGSTQMQGEMRQLTLDLIAMSAEAGNDLRIEARALDLLSQALDLVRKPAASGLASVRHQRDVRCLERARAIILADPARLWTIRDLARQVGMNEKKLKESFRDRFGQPIRGFQQETRLTRAREMLLQGLSVTETSLAVGFSNPSYFAYLFQRRYGIVPSTMMVGDLRAAE